MIVYPGRRLGSPPVWPPAQARPFAILVDQNVNTWPVMYAAFVLTCSSPPRSVDSLAEWFIYPTLQAIACHCSEAEESLVPSSHVSHQQNAVMAASWR